MRRRTWIPLLVAAVLTGACNSGANGALNQGKASSSAKPFKQARLIVEINSTDGDAGLQIFLDHEPWTTIALYRPDGSKILDVTNSSVLKGYGLTELFSESSEPSFEEFPLEEFMKLFPEGEYRLTGTTIEGDSIESMVTLTHDFPAGPRIVTPAEDERVPLGGLVVSWEQVTEPAGIEIVGYQVLVVREEPVLRTFSADLPASVSKITVPAEFLEAGAEYKVEVLAIEKNRNQTLTELVFNAA